MEEKKEIESILFQSIDKEVEFEVMLDNDEDTVWATEKQIIDLFGKSRRTIGEHIKKIYSENELDAISTRREFRQVQMEGGRKVNRKVSIYNLDIVISVGYRVKSQRGIEFRKWATKRLKEYLIQGYSINEKLLKNKNEKIQLLEKKIDKLHENVLWNQTAITDGFLNIISKYSKSFVLLNQFDSDSMSIDNLEEKIIYTINYHDGS